MRAVVRSRREVQAELGMGEDLAKAFLAGTGLPDALQRPKPRTSFAKRPSSCVARGATSDQIAAALSVSKSTCSLWLRDVPHPEAEPEAAAAAQERRVAALRGSKTVRQNTGDTHRGCLCITVFQSRAPTR